MKPDYQANKILAAPKGEYGIECIEVAEAYLKLLDPWMPIETAPKDGVEILTYSKSWGIKQLCWKSIDYKDGSWGSKLPIEQQGAWVLFNSDPNKIGCFNPTNEIILWMPLPLPPNRR